MAVGPDSGHSVRVLLVEDSPFDAHAIQQELKRGFDGSLEIRHISSADEYGNGLTDDLDLILLDYNIPSLDVFTAMDMARARGVNAPVLIITGEVGDEIAAECIKRGASDYILKDRMGRLPQAVSAALEHHRLKIETLEMQLSLDHTAGLFQAAFEAGKAGMALVAPDNSYLMVNDSLCRIVGYTREELMRMRWMDLTHPDDLPRNVDQVQALLSGESESYSIVKRYLHKDGRTVWVEVSDGAVRGPAGEPVCVVTQVQDVTERKLAEEALEESQKLLRGVIDNSPLLIYMKKVDGTYALVSAAWLDETGLAHSDVEGRRDADLFPPGIAVRLREMDEKVIRSGAPEEGEEEFSFYDEEPRVYRSTRFPVFDGAGVCHAVCGILEDVTEEKRVAQQRRDLEMQLNQAQKMEAVGQLAGGIAHDFNNILAVILSYGEFLSEDLDEDDARRSDVMEIVAAGERGAQLVQQLLSFSRKEVVQKQVIDTNDVIGGLHHMLRRTIGEDIQLVIDAAPDLPAVEVDPGQLEQIVMNLAVNARDAMPQGGALRISTSESHISAGDRAGLSSGRYVSVMVQDSGKGIDLDVIDHIFEPFFTTKGRGEGTGLGLATVFGIAKQNNGGVYAESIAEGGTLFTVYLPVTDREAELVALSNAVSQPGTCRGRVLVVEDEASVRELVTRILAKAGYDVTAIGTGSEALAYCRGNAALDLLLTDVVMPEMSGRRLAEEVSSIRPGIKTLFMSGYTDELIASKGILGSDMHLIKKPFKANELIEKVRSLLSADMAVGSREPSSWRGRKAGRALDEEMARYIASLRALDEDGAGLRAMAEMFAEHVPQMADALIAARASDDPDACRRAAHSLVGTCAIVGAAHVTKMIRKVEAECAEGQLPSQDALAAIKRTLEETIAEVSREAGL